MRKHNTFNILVFLLTFFNYTLNAKSLNIALFLPFSSSTYSKMVESIHSGINDSLNKLDLNSNKKFHESDFE